MAINQGGKWNKNEKEQGVTLCACPKPKVDLVDPERKSLFFMMQTTLWTVCLQLASTAVRKQH